jgi:methyl-accepting chemotaxis protein
MTLQRLLIVTLLAITAALITGLSIIFSSVMRVNSTADNQLTATQSQKNAITQLSETVAVVSPNVQQLVAVSALKDDLARVQYQFANASLTLNSDELAQANTAFDDIAPQIQLFLTQSNSDRETVLRVEDGLWAARIMANKMNDMFLNDLDRIGGDIAVGLSEQIAIVRNELDRLSASGVQQVTESVSTVTAESESVGRAANLVERGVASIAERASNVIRTVITVAVVVIILGSILGMTLIRRLNHATNQVMTTLNDISRHKTISKRIHRAQKDELGLIARDIDTMMAEFENVLRKVRLLSGSVTQEITDMSRRGIKLNDLVVDQLDSVTSITSAVTELSASAQEVSDNASSTANNAEEANEIGKEGAKIVSKSINNVMLLSTQLDEAQTNINTLAQDVQSITQVLSVIEAIAEQTNLLALNAAIEAARAGEQGRGFAVVADEVRSLAGRTQQSTVEIRSTIENLQKRTQEVVASMDASKEVSNMTVAQSQSAAQSIEKISSAIAEIMGLTQVIATAAREQSEAAKEISTRVVTLSDSSNNIADLSEQNRLSGVRMSSEGHELDEAISVFTFTEEHKA